MKTTHIVSLVIFSHFTLLYSQAVELYSTDFSEFDVGENQLAGNDGWGSTVTDKGLHGIDSEVFADMGNSAFLGYNPPEEAFTSVWKTLDYDPITEGTPLLHFSGDIAIVDSENEKFDNFYISIWNSNIQLLATINFDNTNQSLWRQSDPSGFIDLDKTFVTGRIYRLAFTIDFEDNQWSATLGDEELFTDVPFHTGGRTLNVESIDFEWEVGNVETPGNNWMFFDNITISATAKNGGPILPPVLDMITLNNSNEPVIEWYGQQNIQYQVQFSTDLTGWSNSLPGSTFTGEAGGGDLTYTDETADLSTNRYYRVIIVADE